MAEDTPTAAPGVEPTPLQPAAIPNPPDVSTSPAAAAAPVTADVPAPVANPAEAASLDSLDQFSIEELLKQANFEDASSTSGTPAAGEVPNAAPGAEGFKFPAFQQALQDAQVSSIDLLRDVELNVKIELGRSRMLVEDVLKLSEGSVVELDKLAGDPVDVFVNDRLVARGEVLVLNDNFCVRVNEIVAGVKDEGL
jgi:flagellar motor switch protein FliN/FliY